MKLRQIIFLIIITLITLELAVAQQKVAAQETAKAPTSKPSFQQVSHPPVIPEAFKKESEEKEWEVAGLPNPWLIQDNNNDGRPDYALIVYDSNFSKSKEGIDSNYDGFIDDFAYFNEDGEIIYQEIDSNYDRKIDIWVEIANGKRVIRIQRDLNHDGIVDRDLQ